MVWIWMENKPNRDVIDDPAAQLGRFVDRAAHLEIDTVLDTGDQFAALGEELDLQLLEHVHRLSGRIPLQALGLSCRFDEL